MRRLRSPNVPDPLADSLDNLRFRSVVFCLSELRAPWGFSVEARDFSSFHLITAGRALLTVDGVGSQWISAGDLVILPHGHAHSLRDHPSSRATRLDRLIDKRFDSESGRLSAGGEGAATTVLCGGFHQEGLAAQTLNAALPPILYLQRDRVDRRLWAGLALSLLTEEAGAFRPGADAVIKRFAELLFVDAVRAHVVSRDGLRRRFVAGFHDPRIDRAIHAIQGHPAGHWTLSNLAREAAMSRTAFACRFRDIMGMPPGSFMTRVRMTQAADLLRSTRLTMTAIAGKCGYRSDAAFSRSFKRLFGKSPHTYRIDRDGHGSRSAELPA